MSIETLLSGLSTSEKLEAMEWLWSDLSQTSRQYVSPEWHREVLAQRLANPAPGDPLPLAEAMNEVRGIVNARRTSG